MNTDGLHLDFDGAWPTTVGNLARVDLRSWGPRLRFITTQSEIERFRTEIEPVISRIPYLLFGSGDFHHLTAIWLRRFLGAPEVLVSFDNHPDWDMRPPGWSCGGWINRALAGMPALRLVSVWGLGGGEYWWPRRLFANHRALRSGRLEVHAWADETRRRWQPRLAAAAMHPGDWRERFLEFTRRVAGLRAYVTIDLDCLTSEGAVTNWESGRFTVEDVIWALQTLRASAIIMGGDLCGAWSRPVFARRGQAWASQFDHPRLGDREVGAAREINGRALDSIWPALTGAAAASGRSSAG